MDRELMAWARKLQAVAQSGLHYTESAYERERYEQVLDVAREIFQRHTDLPEEHIRILLRGDWGYATPKVDVRGVVFRDGKILMVREVADNHRWTLPGGWVDVNDQPARAVEREVEEESGFSVRAVKLLALWDREKQGHTPAYPVHVYKLFFRCEIMGGEAKTSHETSETAFFGRAENPELSLSRITRAELGRLFAHYDNPELPADFD
jgi:ADP-ribose pyrophosphatase YjhB (NUDIX family)